MPAGGDADADATPPEEELDALEEAVDRLLRRYAELRERVAAAEETREAFEEALTGTEPGDLEAGEAVSRFRELAEENRRLRSRIEEGRERAERIRSRLIMMEDEL
jgi:predicted RNase H-like nuclease (RuvC/YqgF family)